MSIFQNTIFQKYLKTLNQETINQKWEVFKGHFHNIEIQENIRNSKEEQYQGEFLIDLFVNVLGYTKNPTPKFNLTTEYKNVKDSKKADGAIIINDKVVGIIELKGTNTTDLSKIEDQAFGYKNNQPDCKYIITSNFEKIRFYIDNAIDHLEFNLFTLSEEDFKQLYLCLSFESLNSDIPKKIKDESLSQEDIITKRLYKDYSLFKRELFQNLTELNPDINQLELFKKSQKLIDRFLFLFFGEDRFLLPPNSVRLILSDWRDLLDRDEQIPLYDRFKKYFGYLNTGFEGKRYSVFAYNGGLFKPDEILDNITIDSELLYKHTFKLSEYDFGSEIDVNILGHIFENSLNEIDEIKAQLEGQEIDKSKTKRKKDGVFYTPKYITKYIVENTVGKLCEEKKAEIGIVEEEYIADKKRQQKTKLSLLQKLDDYRNWLHQITIIDPACGSGAFLNEALNFLISEHKYIDELEAKLTGSSIAFTYHSESILENNLFGVDLNEESVEIAKLSLWLRTAEPNRKLNSLNKNIKCGNSLIDDPEIAGDKAFIWEKEFPQVFAKGGFDVVIGNPPYVGTKQIDSIDRDYYWEKYSDLLFSEMDLYQIFMYKSISELLKINGKMGFITPNSYFTNVSFRNLRYFIVENFVIKSIIDFPYRFYPFDDVNTETAIIIIDKKHDSENVTSFKVIDKNKQLVLGGMSDVYRNEIKIRQVAINDKYKGMIIINANNIVNKLIGCENVFGDYLELHKGWMSVPSKVQLSATKYEKGIFSLEEIINDEELKKHANLFLEGRDIHRYYLDKVEKYVYINDIDNKTKNWHFSPKIILQRIVGQNKNKIFATVDLDNRIIFPNANLVNLKKHDDNIKFYLAILNSNLISYFYNLYYGESNTNLTKLAFESLPIPNLDFIDKSDFINLVDKLISLIENLKLESEKFQRALQREFSLESLSKKLQNWYELSFADFLKELSKAKVNLSLSQKAEWEDYFLAEQQKAVSIKSKIDQTDKEIDQMVYNLYGLTKEEIEIVESN